MYVKPFKYNMYTHSHTNMFLNIFVFIVLAVYFHFIKNACDCCVNSKHRFARRVNIIEGDVSCRHWRLEMTNGYTVVKYFPL